MTTIILILAAILIMLCFIDNTLSRLEKRLQELDTELDYLLKTGQKHKEFIQQLEQKGARYNEQILDSKRSI